MLVLFMYCRVIGGDVVDLRLERANIKRTYAAILMTLLLLLGFCLASISPYKLSADTLQPRDGVSVYLSAFNIISQTISTGDISCGRLRFYNLFAAACVIAIPGPASGLLSQSGVAASIPGIAETNRGTLTHGADMVARK
jgi:hypothetical protein